MKNKSTSALVRTFVGFRVALGEDVSPDVLSRERCDVPKAQAFSKVAGCSRIPSQIPVAAEPTTTATSALESNKVLALHVIE